jgi:hypothetical protein
MIEVKIDTDAVAKKIEAMRHKVDHFKRVDIGAELSAWQTEDLHRHRPFTMRNRREGRATTKLRPHSVYEMKRSALYQRHMARRVVRGGRRAMRVFTHWESLTSTRAILRAEMETRLVDRMRQLLREKIRWA